MNTVENLRKLANYIEQHVPQERLYMRSYRSGPEGGGAVEFKSLNDCGTSGCALGWGPFVEGLEPVEGDYYSHSNKVLAWGSYSERVLPQLGFFTEDWCEVFDPELSSEKSEVLKRLRSKANQLENRDAS